MPTLCCMNACEVGGTASGARSKDSWCLPAQLHRAIGSACSACFKCTDVSLTCHGSCTLLHPPPAQAGFAAQGHVIIKGEVQVNGDVVTGDKMRLISGFVHQASLQRDRYKKPVRLPAGLPLWLCLSLGQAGQPQPQCRQTGSTNVCGALLPSAPEGGLAGGRRYGVRVVVHQSVVGRQAGDRLLRRLRCSVVRTTALGAMVCTFACRPAF